MEMPKYAVSQLPPASPVPVPLPVPAATGTYPRNMIATSPSGNSQYTTLEQFSPQAVTFRPAYSVGVVPAGRPYS